MATVDHSDTKRALVQHRTSGDQWIVEYASVWDGESCVGTQIIAATEDAIEYAELGQPGQHLEPSPELFDRIDAWNNLTSENAEWLQGLDDDGMLSYPAGVR